jgi:hypothetical protein
MTGENWQNDHGDNSQCRETGLSCDRCSGRLGPKANLLVYEVVQGGYHEEHLLLQENTMRNKQERTKEFKQQAGPGIWRCGTPKDAQKQQHKKVARKKCNRNWQGSRRNDVEAVNQVFGANEVEIKQKSRKHSGFSGRLIMHLTRFANTSLTAQSTYEPKGPLIPAEVRK